MASQQARPQAKKGRGDASRIRPWMWKKGQSGNPGGKPKHDLSAQIARAAFEKDPEGIKRAVLQVLKKGNPKMYMVLSDRAYGRLPQALDVDLNATLHSLSDKELAAKLAALRQKEKE